MAPRWMDALVGDRTKFTHAVVAGLVTNVVTAIIGTVFASVTGLISISRTWIVAIVGFIVIMLVMGAVFQMLFVWEDRQGKRGRDVDGLVALLVILNLVLTPVIMASLIAHLFL